MIVVTGAAGFIGSNIVADLKKVVDEQIAVCDWGCRQTPNLRKHTKVSGIFDAEIPPESVFPFLTGYKEYITTIIHMGAISSTTCHDLAKLSQVNTQLTIDLWLWCAQNEKRFIYASSASVYGNESTFSDVQTLGDLQEMKPLNDYGRSKLAADMAITMLSRAPGPKPPQWVGLRFFNVYGPNEWHKGDQASIITKAYGKNVIDLFDVPASRDFVYVKDCSQYVMRFLEDPGVSGIFNVGTEQSRTFQDIARIMGIEVNLIPMPEALKGQYQFRTKAVMNRAKYHNLWFPPTSLEDGILDYTESYLSSGPRYR